jgi:hypothetical protein
MEDEDGNKLYVPGLPNVMTYSLDAVSSLKETISSPENRYPTTYDLRKGGDLNRISIRQMYRNRFGDNTPVATLPVEKDK